MWYNILQKETRANVYSCHCIKFVMRAQMLIWCIRHSTKWAIFAPYPRSSLGRAHYVHVDYPRRRLSETGKHWQSAVATWQTVQVINDALLDLVLDLDLVTLLNARTWAYPYRRMLWRRKQHPSRQFQPFCMLIVQELCESRGGRPGLSVLTNLLVSVDVKNYWTELRHWSKLVPNMSNDIWGH